MLGSNHCKYYNYEAIPIVESKQSVVISKKNDSIRILEISK